MASTDARPVPLKNVAYRHTFPIFDASGGLVSGAAGLDSEVSKDAGTFTDCTNEATEIATASGMYYLDLTATEMNADCVAVIVKTSTVGAKTTPIILYPEEVGDIRVNVTQINVPVSVASYATTTAYPLQPTVAGRTIGVEVSGAVTSVEQVNGGVSVASYATTTAAPLQPTVAGRTVNIEADGSVLNTVNLGSAVAVGSINSSVLLDLRNQQFIVADSLSSPVVGTDTLELGATTAGLNDEAVVGCIFVLKDSNKEVKSVRRIKAYEFATNKITVDVPWGTYPPIDTDWYEIIAFSPVLDENVNGYSARELLRLISATLAGKSSGAQTGVGQIVFRDPADTKDVVTADFDANGNRTAVTLDAD